jgi:hypothetical protein
MLKMRDDNTGQTLGPIRPESVARKLAAIYNYEHPKLLAEVQADPKLPELLWFVQYMSLQPGGLGKFSTDLVELMPESFGTVTMRGLPDRDFSLEEKAAIWNEIPPKHQPHIKFCTGLEGVENLLDGATAKDLAGYEPCELRKVKTVLKDYDMAKFRAVCHKAVIEELPKFLHAICSHPEKPFSPQSFQVGGNGWEDRGKDYRETWYADVWECLNEFMQRRATTIQARIAMTEVAAKTFDALDYALEAKAMVRIEGDSRFGKTEAVKAWCDMRPGRARHLSTPCSNSVGDLIHRVAEALGMDVSYGSRPQGLRQRIEYVLKHSGLFIILDEAHFLIPQSYALTTAPARLNWVRTEIVDRGLPVAMVVTPQAFLPALTRFAKRTGYTMEQFFGRNFRTVLLPDALSEADMVAVAKIHAPEFEEDYLPLIADLAAVSENYLQAVEAIIKLARHLARREKHKRVGLADIEAAASEVIPQRPKPEHSEPAQPGQPRINGPLKAVKRAVKGRAEAGSITDFQPCSLRGQSPAPETLELVSVEP